MTRDIKNFYQTAPTLLYTEVNRTIPTGAFEQVYSVDVLPEGFTNFNIHANSPGNDFQIVARFETVNPNSFVYQKTSEVSGSPTLQVRRAGSRLVVFMFDVGEQNPDVTFSVLGYGYQGEQFRK